MREPVHGDERPTRRHQRADRDQLAERAETRPEQRVAVRQADRAPPAARTTHGRGRSRPTQRSAPKKSTASARPIEKANSPASVEGMLPPHMEFASMKRKQSGARAPSAGPGNGMPAQPQPEVRADRQQEVAEHRHQLEGDGERDELAEQRDQDERQREVELEEREAAVVPGAPPRDLALRQQRVAQVDARGRSATPCRRRS